MKLSIIPIALALSVTSTIHAADPDGWGKVKWGFTKAQVKQAYPEAKDYRNPDGKMVFGVPNFDVNYVRFRMDFTFSDKGLLKRIALRPSGYYNTNTMVKTAKIFITDLDNKLGPSKITETKDGLVTYDWGGRGSKTTATMLVFPETGPDYAFHSSLTPDPDDARVEKTGEGSEATFHLLISGPIY